MELHPKIELKKLLNEKDVHLQIKKDIEFRDIDINRYYEYSKQWWNNFKQIHEGFSKRIIKIYAENEYGIYIPSCSYIHPLTNINVNSYY